MNSQQPRPHIGFSSPYGVLAAVDSFSTPDTQDLARYVEELGFGSFFFPEGAGKESLTQAAALLAATDDLVIGTGIANIHRRDAVATEAAARHLHAAYPDRFVLGLGVSHPQLVEGKLNLEYGKPLTTMRNYLHKMEQVPAHVDEQSGQAPRLLAALGPKMVELSGTAAHGALPYLVMPEHTASTRQIVGPDAWVVTEVGVSLGSDDEVALRRAHEHLTIYTGLDNYRASWRRQGFDDTDFVHGGSERLARALIGLRDDAVAAVNAHLDAGADHVLVQVLGDTYMSDPRADLATMADRLGLKRRSTTR